MQQDDRLSKAHPVIRNSKSLRRRCETVAAGLFTTLIVLFYLLVAGKTFPRRVVEILPHFDDKRHAVQISMHIERDISVYLISVTLINALVGLLTLAVMWGCGVANLLRALGHFPEA